MAHHGVIHKSLELIESTHRIKAQFEWIKYLFFFNQSFSYSHMHWSAIIMITLINYQIYRLHITLFARGFLGQSELLYLLIAIGWSMDGFWQRTEWLIFFKFSVSCMLDHGIRFFSILYGKSNSLFEHMERGEVYLFLSRSKFMEILFNDNQLLVMRLILPKKKTSPSYVSTHKVIENTFFGKKLDWIRINIK